jgi:hypothetical protein
MIQNTSEVSSNDWLKNNYGDKGDVKDVDPFDDDFFLNGPGETTDFTYLPSDATKQHTEAISDNTKRVIVGSGVPELFWPGLATGNHASTDIQKDLGISYIHDLRRELNRSYNQLFNQNLTIKGFLEQTQYTEVRNGWDQFELVSKEAQARIFQMFTAGIGAIIQNAGGSYDDIKYFFDKFYPDMPERTRKKLKDGMFELMTDHTLQLKGDVYSETDTKVAGEGDDGVGEDDADEGAGDDLDDDAEDMEGLNE